MMKRSQICKYWNNLFLVQMSFNILSIYMCLYKKEEVIFRRKKSLFTINMEETFSMVLINQN